MTDLSHGSASAVFTAFFKENLRTLLPAALEAETAPAAEAAPSCFLGEDLGMATALSATLVLEVSLPFGTNSSILSFNAAGKQSESDKFTFKTFEQYPRTASSFFNRFSSGVATSTLHTVREASVIDASFLVFPFLVVLECLSQSIHHVLVLMVVADSMRQGHVF